MFRWFLVAVVLCSLLFPRTAVFGQAKREVAPREPATRMEAFLAKKGNLIVRDSYSLGEVSGLGKIAFDALIVYQPGVEAQSLRGMRVEITEAGSYEHSDVSLLDLDELEGLSAAITYMTNLAREWEGTSRDPYTEVMYCTKGGFTIGFYHSGMNQEVFARSGYVSQTTMSMTVDDLSSSLQTIIDEGLTLLKKK